MTCVLELYSFPEKRALCRLESHMPASAEKCRDVRERVAVGRMWRRWANAKCLDMFGLSFPGHPELKRILLPDEWQGYPLRKDYDICSRTPRGYGKILELRAAVKRFWR